MTLFTNFIFLPLIIGIISLLFLNKMKKIQWSLFFVVSVYLLISIIKYYNKWDTTNILEILPFIKLTLKVTPFGWFFSVISIALTVLISIFSLSYNDKKHASAIAPLWIMLLAANFGIFLASDWLMFFIVWELMSWTSFFIISQGKKLSFKAGIYYLALSMIGTVSFLISIFLIFNLTHSFDLTISLAKLAHLLTLGYYKILWIVALLTITFFTKSAIFPFYMWPAKAHAEAPDDFSAFLSGVMIKYGVYGFLVTLVPLFMQTKYGGILIHGVPLPMYIVAWFGAITGVIGTILAIMEIDMKRLMAYSTVANMGYIISAFAILSPMGIAGGMFHATLHMLFKSSIFLALAAVKFRTGERLMHRLGGIAYRMPITFFVFLLGIIAAASIPPTGGFPAKWVVYQSIFQKKMVFIGIFMFFTTTGSFMYLYRTLHSVFLGQLSPRFKNIKEAPLFQLIPMVTLMIVTLVVGLFPGIITKMIAKLQIASGYEAIKTNWTTISGYSSHINFFMVGVSFMGAAVCVFILYLISNKRNHVEPMDNYSAGETPEDWGTTPEKYHAAYLFNHHFREEFMPRMQKIDLDKFFSIIGFEFKRLGSFFKSCFEQNLNFAIINFIVLILIGLVCIL